LHGNGLSWAVGDETGLLHFLVARQRLRVVGIPVGGISGAIIEVDGTAQEGVNEGRVMSGSRADVPLD